MVQVSPAPSDTPVTVICCPDGTFTDPHVELVYPPPCVVVVGAVQPDGTVRSIWPPFTPPVAAVYVNVSVLPVASATAKTGDTASCPAPSAAYTVSCGEEPSG